MIVSMEKAFGKWSYKIYENIKAKKVQNRLKQKHMIGGFGPPDINSFYKTLVMKKVILI